MKFVLLSLALLIAVQVYAEPLREKEYDRTHLNSLGDKKFDMNSMKGGSYTPKESSFGKKMFSDKKSSLLSEKRATGFGKELPLKNAKFDKEFKTSAFVGFKKENAFLSAQKRFDTTKKAPYSEKMLTSDIDKVSSLDGKKYLGKESEIIRKHLDELQQEQYEKLDLDETSLSVEQIREMLNKDK